MDEYISREALKKEVRRLSTHYLNEWDTLGVLSVIDRISDVIVRCKNCKHWEPNDETGGYCAVIESVVENPDFFCAAGE